ncbi:MAG: nucleotide exchange factor GrpE [Candidatus Marsarchaeota archaeon]|nr:nucleotide exchange factor GrpE [Candidatus Marsarchaeota archaeon]
MANGNGNGKAQNEEATDADNETKAEKTEEVDYKDRLMRLAAEFDNYKKKARSDMENAKVLGKAEIVRDLLPVLDEFELALISIKESGDKGVTKGIELLYSNFFSSLKKVGLQEIKTDGRFDPYRHEIILTQDAKGKSPGTILAVTKKGYVIGDILLRPASVIVAKEREEEEKEKGNEEKE